MNFIAHDYETTGTDQATCGVVQSAIVIADIDILGNWEIVAQEVALHNPGCPIPAGASRVHGIYDNDVAHLDNFEINLMPTYDQAMSEFSPQGVIGYNSIKFDNVIARRVGMPEGLVEIDMMVAANRLMSRGKLERARLVDAYEALTGKPAENAHDALADVIMTLELIQPVMREMNFGSLPDLIGWLEKPEVNPDMSMPFGKHKGLPVSKVPKGYLRWLMGKGGLTQDLHLSIQEVMG